MADLGIEKEGFQMQMQAKRARKFRGHAHALFMREKSRVQLLAASAVVQLKCPKV